METAQAEKGTWLSHILLSSRRNVVVGRGVEVISYQSTWSSRSTWQSKSPVCLPVTSDNCPPRLDQHWHYPQRVYLGATESPSLYAGFLPGDLNHHVRMRIELRWWSFLSDPSCIWNALSYLYHSESNSFCFQIWAMSFVFICCHGPSGPQTLITSQLCEWHRYEGLSTIHCCWTTISIPRYIQYSTSSFLKILTIS